MTALTNVSVMPSGRVDKFCLKYYSTQFLLHFSPVSLISNFSGPRCEGRMQNIPFRPLSERMLKEPFWLGIITVTVVLGVIGLVWCLKRHMPEKLEKFLNEDLDKNRRISWGNLH